MKKSVMITMIVIFAFVINITIVLAESTDSDPGSLQVTKEVEWGGLPPDGFQTFEICISGPSYPSDPSCVELGDGQSATWLELYPGEYTVTETDPGPLWIVSGSGQVIVVASGQTSTTTVTNTNQYQAPGSLQVIKEVEWGGLPPDESQTFEICISGPTYPSDPSCVELGDGQSATWLELDPGEYTVTETDPGPLWIVSGSGQVIVVASGQTSTTTVTNTYQPPGSLKVTKVVDWGGLPPDGFQTFEICISGPSYPSDPSCVELRDGESATWLNLEPGEYTVTETDPGPLWTVSGSGQIVVVASGQQTNISIINTFANQPPVADPNGPYLAGIGIPITFDGTASYDPDGDELSFSWQFGDGSPVTGGSEPSHVYFTAGIYTVCLTVNDGYVNSEQVCTSAIIYDPDAGFVTGGGWIDSQEGAYKPDPSLMGKATFGFVSKYKKGARVPTGNTEFQFQTAVLNFQSSDYEWLVVNQGGTNAQFKGTGTINDEGEYKFMLWAGDCEPDTFRIKIWWEESGIEYVVYDNGFDQAIGGGSIVVHTGK